MAIVKTRGWAQVDVAGQCGVTKPRMEDLLKGRVSRFSLDDLISIATAIDYRVHVGLVAV